MDVETALALATAATSAAVGGAATEAGRRAWESLAALVRRATGRGAADGAGAGAGAGDDAADAAAGSAPDDAVLPADPEALTGRIIRLARTDEEFAARLCRWAATHGDGVRADVRLTGTDRSRTVHNTVSGGATVVGPVVQADEIHGGVTFN
ncbi:hypothetical protein V1L54_22655 [Streptomyces sp. TRM 70361]|uniref:hypothetical protein n=1 Tax=Streptomyces sp. TRM 70361 TaxID=3116553 RepID=UPI002E7B820C|nr:hypothetical protein [Streptomyces sp. TRM 70361]MEE1942165.1 hypothetical protein [Streptomyces sp. TRM 70361]